MSLNEIRSRALEGLARVDTALMREFLAGPGVRPEVDECVWVDNAPKGPSMLGIAAVTFAIGLFGEENVTTGNANPPSPDLVGVYVRRGS